MKIIKKIFNIAKKYLYKTTIQLVAIEKIHNKDRHQYFTSLPTIETKPAKQIPFDPEAQHLQPAAYYQTNIYTLTLKDIIYCAPYNILLTTSRQIISESISTQKNPQQFDLAKIYLSKTEKISGICSTIRSHKNGYYHTIIDNLPRLYLLNHSIYQDIPEIKLLFASTPTPVEQFFLDKLQPKNSKVTVVEEDKLYYLEQCIFPSFLSRRFSGYLPTQYLNWFLGRVTPQRPRKKVNRIFISRSATWKGRQRCILNEDELFASLQPYGFKKYTLGQMPMESQIELFYDAEFVIGAHGAGLTNLIFSSNAKVLELFPTPFVLPHYYYLSKSLGHDYSYWCSEEKGRHSNFSVNISEILNKLASLEQVKI